jgi:hypothetical protein
MKRRELIILVGCAALDWPLAVRAQQLGKVYRLGFLWGSPNVYAEAIEAFRQGPARAGVD